jgi:hypothetical protein
MGPPNSSRGTVVGNRRTPPDITVTGPVGELPCDGWLVEVVGLQCPFVSSV